MPSATRMYAGRCRAVALAVVLGMLVVAPAAAYGAPTTTTKPGPASTTTTTAPPLLPSQVPPPPPFTLPIEYGLQLLAQRAEAGKDLYTYSAALPGDRAAAKAALVKWKALQARLQKLEAQVRQTQHDLDVAHENLQQAAVEAYINAGSGRLETAITAMV